MTHRLLLKSQNLFDGIHPNTFSGYVLIQDDKIVAVNEGAPADNLQKDTKIYDLGNRLITPGFVDVHCFFSGLAMNTIGIDCSDAATLEDIIPRIDKYHLEHPEKPILGHGLNSQNSIIGINAAIEEKYPSTPVIIMYEGADNCVMNKTAIKEYQFDSSHCYPEAYFRLMSEVLQDKDYIVPKFLEYMRFMNSRGITAVKEVSYDDYSGFTKFLKELKDEHRLTLRYNFTSQPIATQLSLSTGFSMSKTFSDDEASFSGFNIMTDGSISEHKAELKQPYSDLNTHNLEPVNWTSIEQQVLKADKAGYRVALHAQGDAAIAKSIAILSKCIVGPDGHLKNRHCITDLEFSDPQDLIQMGKLGIVAEVYPQIQSLSTREEKLNMIKKTIGEKRGSLYWNRRKMLDAGIVVSCGTDLPLLFDNIPVSIYHAAGGYFPEGGPSFNEENTMTRSEVLKAWTYGGAYNLGQEEKIGTLEAGKYADIAVLDNNVLTMPMSTIRNAKVDMTICAGKVVYSSI